MVKVPCLCLDGNPWEPGPLFKKWLEELASESNTIQAQEDITQPGKSAGNIEVKLYMIL